VDVNPTGVEDRLRAGGSEAAVCGREEQPQGRHREHQRDEHERAEDVPDPVRVVVDAVTALEQEGGGDEGDQSGHTGPPVLRVLRTTSSDPLTSAARRARSWTSRGAGRVLCGGTALTTIRGCAAGCGLPGALVSFVFMALHAARSASAIRPRIP
jgi:hypothetical protein